MKTMRIRLDGILVLFIKHIRKSHGPIKKKDFRVYLVS